MATSNINNELKVSAPHSNRKDCYTLPLQAAENIFLDLSEAFLMFQKSISKRLPQNTLQTGKKRTPQY